MTKILFCGDFVSQSPHRIKIDDKLKSILLTQDYAVVNFEAPIEGHGKPIYKSGPSLIQSQDSPLLLEELGFNIILLANNHMMDQGTEGCAATIDSFSKALTIGVGGFNEAYKLTIIKHNNLKIGLLCFCHKEFGVLDIDSKFDDYGTAWINHPYVNKTIYNAKKECDFLVVLPHAGIEDMIVPLPEWKARYHEFIDLGADAVIASHPHTPQGWEEYEGKMIFYSLGNFFFESFGHQHSDNWYKGLIVQLSISDDLQIDFNVINTKFSDNALYVDESEESQKYNQYLCGLLKDEEKYRYILNKYLEKLWPEYKLYMLRGLAALAVTSNMRVLLHAAYGLIKGPDLPLLINNFQCESHRWAIERMLNLLKNN